MFQVFREDASLRDAETTRLACSDIIRRGDGADRVSWHLRMGGEGLHSPDQVSPPRRLTAAHLQDPDFDIRHHIPSHRIAPRNTATPASAHRPQCQKPRFDCQSVVDHWTHSAAVAVRL
jgi:hypothetical protein